MPTKSSASGSSDEEDVVTASKNPDTRPKSSLTTHSAAAAAKAPKPSPSKAPAFQAEEAESSGGEDEDEDEDEDGSSSDSGDNQTKPPQTTTAKASDSGSSYESGSDTDSDHPPAPPRHSSRVADPSVKPLASKPMDAPAPSKSPKKPQPPPPSPSPSPSPASKKRKATEATPDTAKQFKRIWSDKDEITILRGWVDYQAKKGATATPSSSDMEPFRDFIHKSLGMEINKTQLYEKVRRLKNKYERVTSQKNPSLPFAKPHDSTVYELSQMIWGSKNIHPENGNNNNAEDGDADGRSMTKPRKTKEEHNVAAREDDHPTAVVKKVRYPFLMAAVSQIEGFIPSSVAVEEVLGLFDESKAMAAEHKYKKQWIVESKNHLRQMDLTKDTKKMIMEALEKLG